MKEIEVGEYVRTNNGIIGKITDIDICEICEEKTYIISLNYQGKILHKNYITKHSKNIINLIEVGDYVNGYVVLDVMEDVETGELHLEMPMDYTNNEKGDCTIYNSQIKSILTKEQYENNCYRLEE